jgi:cellulose synthase/poly-beta-1,6-N-acetylglucosamine synthase-like glycosyltransferase
LGFLHVLPGAWSAYRYKALIKSDEYEPNLLEHSYFKMTLNPDMELSGYQEANMYLAEDRILSLGIYCQPDCKYYLKYVPDAGARTDPMKSHEDLMKQRRRWINSSLFAFFYVFKNYYFNAIESSHGVIDRYFSLNLSMILSLLSFATSYFTPSLYFYVIYATVAQISVTSQTVAILAKIAALIFVVIYLVAIAGGLSGSVWTKHAEAVSIMFSFITFVMIGLVTYNIVEVYLGLTKDGIDWSSFNQVSILVMCAANIGGYLLIVGLHLFTHLKLAWRLLVDTVSYWFY